MRLGRHRGQALKQVAADRGRTHPIDKPLHTKLYYCLMSDGKTLSHQVAWLGEKFSKCFAVITNSWHN